MNRCWLGGLAFVGIMGIVLPAAADDGPSAATIESARQSVVQVLADDCEGGARAGSGFIYGAHSTVVSALHVVAGCSSVKVYFEHHGFEREAHVVRSSPARDLVMIEVEDSPELTPLERTPGEPTSTQRLQAIGFHESPTMENLEVTVSGGANRLRNLLPQQARLEVERSTKVDVEAPIVRLNKPLLPGFSGGPIIDREGKVAAISAGGLRAGTIPVSFGWPARFIDELEASTSPVEQVAAAPSPIFFSAARESDALTQEARKGMTCGKLELVRQSTLSLEQIALTSDDQSMISWLIQLLALENEELASVTFDLWVHEESGATIPLPSTVSIEPGGDWCIARAQSGPYRLLVRGEGGLPIEAELTPFGETNQASLRFDEFIRQEILNRIGEFVFEPDMAVSDMVANVRPDGFVTRHEAGYASAPFSNELPVYVYATHMARNGTYVGIAAINDQVDVALSQMCTYAAYDPQCVAFRQALAQWAPMIFAASMATYPIQ
jgi:hypothetical protein